MRFENPSYDNVAKVLCILKLYARFLEKIDGVKHCYLTYLNLVSTSTLKNKRW